MSLIGQPACRVGSDAGWDDPDPSRAQLGHSMGQARLGSGHGGLKQVTRARASPEHATVTNGLG